MLQGVQRNRPTEIEYLNGEVVRLDRQVQGPTLLNMSILDLVHVEQTQSSWPVNAIEVAMRSNVQVPRDVRPTPHFWECASQQALERIRVHMTVFVQLLCVFYVASTCWCRNVSLSLTIWLLHLHHVFNAIEAEQTNIAASQHVKPMHVIPSAFARRVLPQLPSH